MITKADWQDAYREILEDGRERIGPPPTPEKIEDLFAGRLSDEEAERVREALAYYPELLRVMTEPVPEDPSSVVSDEEVAAGLARLRQRIRRESTVAAVPRRRPLRRVLIPAAALAILLTGGILAYRLTHRVDGVPVLLSADGELAARGTEQTPHQLSTETDYLLEPAFLPERKHEEYNLELVDLTGDAPRVVESWDDVHQQPNGSFPVPLSTKGFAEGRYQLVLYGVDDDAPVRLATYTIRLSRP